MSAEWFCKVGDKKIGPLTGQQLKAIVAKGKLLPEHLVCRGEPGQWVPAGRVKGLFPDQPAASGDAKPAAQPAKKDAEAAKSTDTPADAKKAGDRPTAKAVKLTKSKEAPEPPSTDSAGDIPEEFALGSAGGKKHHVNLDVGKLQIKAQTVKVTGRRSKGIPGVKQAQQKKVRLILFSVIGGGLFIALVVITIAGLNGMLSSSEPTKAAAKKEPSEAEKKALADKLAAEKAAAEEKAKAASKPSDEWPDTLKPAREGAVEFRIGKPTRGEAPKGSGVDPSKSADVLVLGLMMSNPESKNAVEYSGWGDAAANNIILRDDSKKAYKFLGVANPSNVKSIEPEKHALVKLVFEPPTTTVKYLRLELPSSATGGKRMLKFHIPGGAIPDKPQADAAAAKGK